MKNNKQLTSSIRPGDQCTAPLRIVLHESHSSTPSRPEYVVHSQNMQDGGFFNGHYFSVRTFLSDGVTVDPSAVREALADAMADYAERCVQLGVDPLPFAGVQAIPPGIARPQPNGDHTCDQCGQAYELPTAGFDGLCPGCAMDKARPFAPQTVDNDQHTGRMHQNYKRREYPGIPADISDAAPGL